jgi:hypothetical protein
LLLLVVLLVVVVLLLLLAASLNSCRDVRSRVNRSSIAGPACTYLVVSFGFGW